MSAPGTIEGIILEASRATKLPVSVLLSRSRVHAVTRPRQAMMLVLQERTSLSTPQIAARLGLGDHSTVIHGIRKAREIAALNPDFAGLIERLRVAEPLGPLALADLAQEMPEEVAEAIAYSLRRRTRRRGPDKPKSESIEAQRKAIIRRPVKVRVASLPDKELIHINESHDFLIDADGRDQSEHDMRHDLLVGSMKLAAAINAARRVAA